ncbi:MULTISPECIES: hypothetical protein [unclassified Pseudomonas]|uniref:hypothetical protein n=1 Tax=unclassified Pseudomonas TaxID=196821 RepID=UPI000BCA7D1A|nr:MULTISPECIES: hypothetical protein [unclassified Pseudomonas]PVZ19958.1 hypothetical protein F474_00549 [Pseudomonas sp. URIL14HWK12:I12]PVZ27024.1 hypothetical protein F470_00204 [Pseudomonas sp. URIL14HWK12:I10]PVZ37913.1 hypothetical protein F472_00549 [Pseudomonas sp. URIL14HWK12:I11]SNZ05166.1 hypothetical protein SAMN05660463_00855 [Pseudomonas sp. URIL14HWK12:I9]
MRRRTDTARRMIEKALADCVTPILPAYVHGWAEACIEMAYAQGDVDEWHYDHYTRRLNAMRQGVAA